MTQLRPLIDRVLRLKEQQDALTADIREVYAEAKASGFDKTIMGQVVTFLRKRDKDPVGIAEKGALFETYVTEYDRRESRPYKNTRAHEDQPAHDEETGEILERAIRSTPFGELIEEPSTVCEALDRAGLTLEQINPDTGEIIEPSSARAGVEAREPQGPASEEGLGLHDGPSSHDSISVASSPATEEPGIGQPRAALPGSNFSDDPGEMPPFLKRGDPACPAGRAA